MKLGVLQESCVLMKENRIFEFSFLKVIYSDQTWVGLIVLVPGLKPEVHSFTEIAQAVTMKRGFVLKYVEKQQGQC